jgi:hypothetical protein
VGEGTRSPDIQIHSLGIAGHKGEAAQGVASTEAAAGPSTSPFAAPEALRLPADLARVVAAWPDLAPGLKVAILAILASAGK